MPQGRFHVLAEGQSHLQAGGVRELPRSKLLQVVEPVGVERSQQGSHRGRRRGLDVRASA